MKSCNLILAAIAMLFSVGCAQESSSLEEDLPMIESFVVSRLPDGGHFTHSIEYVVIFPEGLESYTSYSPVLWNDAPSERPMLEGKTFPLAALHPQGKSTKNIRRDGRRSHGKFQYDLSGLLSLESTNYIKIVFGGRNNEIKAVSIPIEP